MTWSYSRITTFEDCPYRFYLKYIRRADETRNFFSDYGSFMHLIIQKFLIGELNKRDLVDYYLINFHNNVVGKPPTYNIFQNYFQQGLEYLKHITLPEEDIVGVEKDVEFKVGNRNFVGYIDKVSRNNNGLIITDNKSRNLKPRSEKKKPTKSDRELDKYLRQLYLYSIPIENEFKELPWCLKFNCFRTQTEITEPFKNVDYDNTKKWASDTIDKISKEQKWSPNIDSFKCRYICDVHDQCDYFKMYES